MHAQLATERAACADLKKRIASLESKASAPKQQQQQKQQTQRKTQAGSQEALPGSCEYISWDTQP